jgi:hypothetical protein
MPGFLIGIVVGALAASAYLKKKSGASLSSGASASSRRGDVYGGRVDELSSAADTGNPESAPFNAGDGTPAGTSRPLSPQSPTTGLSESRH